MRTKSFLRLKKQSKYLLINNNEYHNVEKKSRKNKKIHQ